MALHFRRPIFHKPSQTLLVILGLIGLLIALTVLGSWLAIRFHAAEEPGEEGSSDVFSDETTAADDRDLLIILTELPGERFILLHSSPMNGSITVCPIPGDTALSGKTVAELYGKQGPAAAVSAIADTYAPALRHYVQMDADNAEKWLSYLENGISYTLPEAVEYTAPDGATLRLSAGEQRLTSSQAVMLAGYTGWTNGGDTNRVTAQLVAAMCNATLTADRPFAADFSELCNLSRTSLRIDDFTGWRDPLRVLAGKNTGNIAVVGNIPTKR